MAELQDRLGFRPFGTRPAADLAGWLLPHAIENDRLRDGLSAGGRRIRTFRPSQDHCFSELVEPCAGRRSLDNSSLGRDRGRTAGLGHFDPFRPPRLNGRCPFSYLTSAGASGREKDAPTAAIRRAANNEGHEIIQRNPRVENGARSRRGSGLRFEDSVRCAVCPGSPIHALSPQ